MNRARVLMEEIRSAARKAGHPIEDSFLDRQFEVTATMGAYQPSSLIDFLDGRPVEVDAIWGEPLLRGRRLGVEMPTLEKLNTEIRQALKQRG